MDKEKPHPASAGHGFVTPEAAPAKAGQGFETPKAAPVKAG